jgi:hypothetical protein
MEECSLETVVEKAKSWQAQGKSWHFHLLTPDCVFNTRRHGYALVLENETDGQTYVAYSDQSPMEVDHELVILLHGDEILAEEKITSAPTNEQMQFILKSARELNGREIPWHHHMLPPACIFNSHKGQWNIFFEDKKDDKVVEALYDGEPVDDIRQIEVLFFAQENAG